MSAPPRAPHCRPPLLPLLAVLCFALGAPAEAGDDGETLAQANETIDHILKARKKKDEDLMGASFVRLVELHNGLEGAGMRGKLQAAVGGVLKDKKCQAFHSSAVSTLEQLDDGDGVLKQLKPVLPKAAAAKASDLEVYAVSVIGAVHAPKGIRVLADYAKKAKDLRVATAAAAALGKYRALEKKRVAVYTILFGLLDAARPTPKKPHDEAGRKRWAALEKPLVSALDELTYKDLGTSAKWLAWHAANKAKLKAALAD